MKIFAFSNRSFGRGVAAYTFPSIHSQILDKNCATFKQLYIRQNDNCIRPVVYGVEFVAQCSRLVVSPRVKWTFPNYCGCCGKGDVAGYPNIQSNLIKKMVDQDTTVPCKKGIFRAEFLSLEIVQYSTIQKERRRHKKN